MNRDLLRKQLVRHEGKRGTAYDDKDGEPISKKRSIEGKVTVGIGHNIEDKPLSDNIIYAILEEDIDDALTDCIRMFPNWNDIPENKQAVICNLMFNMGYYTLGKFTQFRGAIAQGHWRTAAGHLKDSKWFRQVGKRGEELVNIMGE